MEKAAFLSIEESWWKKRKELNTHCDVSILSKGRDGTEKPTAAPGKMNLILRRSGTNHPPA
jgi:hypothetical protein